MPDVDGCDGLYRIGWFSGWDESANRMQKAPDSRWVLTLEPKAGCESQYRFRTPDGRWPQDTAAPAPAHFGLNNSFVVGNQNGAQASLKSKRRCLTE